MSITISRDLTLILEEPNEEIPMMKIPVPVMSEGFAAVVVCPPTPPSISLGLTIRGGRLLACLSVH